MMVCALLRQGHLLSTSARARWDKKKEAIGSKERQQTNNNQNGCFFPPEERVPFSQPRKDDSARVVTARAPSQRLSAHAMGQHNNKKRAIGTKERQQRNNNQNGFFFSS